MQLRSIDIAIAHYRENVVVQSLERTPSEEVKRALMTAEDGLQGLISDEFDVARSAPSKRRDEHRQPVTPTPDSRKVNLHLSPWISLESNQRLRLSEWSQSGKVILQDAVPAGVAEAPQLTQQHSRRNPVRRGGLHSLIDGMLVRVKR